MWSKMSLRYNNFFPVSKAEVSSDSLSLLFQYQLTMLFNDFHKFLVL